MAESGALITAFEAEIQEFQLSGLFIINGNAIDASEGSFRANALKSLEEITSNFNAFLDSRMASWESAISDQKNAFNADYEA